MYNFTFTPRVISSYLLSISGILLTANFLVIHRRLVAPDPVLRGFRAAFYFGGEANFPSFFTALLILACAMIAWKASELRENSNRETSCFKMLSALLIILTLQHFFNLHHLLFALTWQVLGSAFSQYFQLIWFIISALLFLVISFCLITGLLFLPAKLKAGFSMAALLYINGFAVKAFIQPAGTLDPTYLDVFTSLIETFALLLQMIGMITLIHTFLSFYLNHVKSPDIRLTFFASQADTPKSEHFDIT